MLKYVSTTTPGYLQFSGGIIPAALYVKNTAVQIRVLREFSANFRVFDILRAKKSPRHHAGA